MMMLCWSRQFLSQDNGILWAKDREGRSSSTGYRSFRRAKDLEREDLSMVGIAVSKENIHVAN
jgi:hypothetical protein